MSFLTVSDQSALLLFVLEVSLKGSLVLAAAGLATSLLRKSPASLRHTIWTTALAVVVILPAIVVYAPRMDVSVLPVSEPQISVLPVGPENLTGWAGGLRQDVRPPAVDSAAGAAEYLTEESTRPRSGFDWKLGLFGAWAAGVLLVLFRYIIGWIALSRIKKRSEPVADVRFRLAAIKVSRSMALTRRVRFVWGDSGGMPLTWGWIRPTVLLPQDAREWEAEKILSVLRHELAHIKRYDCFVQGLVYLVCAVYWFNPLVWIAAANSRREREIACDDYVLTSGTAGTEYADHLIEIARSLRAPTMSGTSTIAMARQSELEGRLMAILSSNRRRGANTRTSMFATMGFLAAVAIPLSALRPVPVDPLVDPEPHLARDVVDESDARVDLGPELSDEAEAYLAQVNEIVEKATRTLES
ncbi:MAG: M56 family metallopeptidase, partial [Rhodothermia bacterium]